LSHKALDDYAPGGSFLARDTDFRSVFIPEGFSEEQRMIAKTTVEFVGREIAALGDKADELNYGNILNIVRKAGEIGLLGAFLPEEYGGIGLNGITFTMMKEKLNAGATSIITTIGGQIGIGMLPIVFFGTAEQRLKYLPKLASGELTTAFALTEPSSGTDASGIKTSARLSEDGKHYILNGNKVFITNAGFADIFVVFAKVNGTDFSAFIVERNSEGLTIGPEEKKMGLKASSTCSMTFENVKVPAENLLGEVGKGHLIAFNVLNFGRLSVGAGCLGNAKEALECAARYANQRVQFGRKIASFPLIMKKLAQINTKLYVLESMVYRTAALFDARLQTLDFGDPNLGERSNKVISEYLIECSINKVFGSEALDYAADEGLQIHGGYGYMQEYKIESIYRDARIKRIFEGTNEINRLFITRSIVRKLAKGQLPELERAIEAASAALEQAAHTQKLTGTLEYETYLVSMAKKICVFALAQALQVYKDKLDEEQETSADLADMAILVYAMESALLRTKKLISQNGEAASQNAIDMTLLFVHEAFEQLAGLAKQVLSVTAAGDEWTGKLALLVKASFRWPVSVPELQRRIAARVSEAEKYVG